MTDGPFRFRTPVGNARLSSFPAPGVPSEPPPPPSCDLLVPLHSTEHHVLHIDTSCALVVARRTTVAYVQIADIEASFVSIERALAGVFRERYALLVDIRRGPSRNDPEFEQAVQQHRGKLLGRFDKVAVVVATAAGRLQIQRHAKADGMDVLVTPDLGVAWARLVVVPHDL